LSAKITAASKTKSESVVNVARTEGSMKFSDKNDLKKA